MEPRLLCWYTRQIKPEHTVYQGEPTGDTMIIIKRNSFRDAVAAAMQFEGCRVFHLTIINGFATIKMMRV